MTVGDNLLQIWLGHNNVRNRVSVKIGDIILEIDVLIIGGPNTARPRCLDACGKDD